MKSFKKQLVIRCPRLGHQIAFSYCRTENRGLPCFKTLNCWYTRFSVEELLKKELSPEEWKQAFESPPKSKVQSLLELIEETKHRQARGLKVED